MTRYTVAFSNSYNEDTFTSLNAAYCAIEQWWGCSNKEPVKEVREKLNNIGFALVRMSIDESIYCTITKA